MSTTLRIAVNKHLVCLWIALAASLTLGTGCTSHRGGGGPGSKIAPLPANSFAQQWFNDLKLSKDTVTKLYLRDDTLFAYTNGDQVFAVGSQGGDLRYLAHPQVSGGKLRPPLVLGNYVVYPSGSTLEIFNKVGRPVKTIDFDKSTRSGAVGLGFTIYLGLDHFGGTGVIASVDINRPYHFVNWELLTGAAVSPTPAIFEKVIYGGSEDGKLYAVSDDRKPIWSLPGGTNTFNTLGQFVSDIKADDYGVYAANTNSKLFCIDRLSGKEKWVYYSGEPLRNSPVIFPTMVYQLVPTVGIVAIDKASGQFNRLPKWIAKDAKQVLSEDANLTYLRGKDDNIIAVDKKTGQTMFTSKTKWDVFATNYTDATIYAATKGGDVIAIRPILKEGEVGTIVLDLRPEPLAMAR